MKKVFLAMYAEIRGLHQSAYLLAGFALASQGLALVRDRLFAHYFGAGPELDVYYAAFKIPDLLFVLFASVLSVYVLIPFISEKTESGNEEGARRILSSVLSVFLGAYCIVALGVAFFADSLASFFFPGFSDGDHATLTILLRILLLQPLLLGISSLYGVITQLGQRFALYAISPLLYNGGIILGVIALYPRMGMQGVVWGVVLGALLHLLIQIPFVRQSRLAPRLIWAIDMRMLGTVLANSIPRALTLSLGQIVLLSFIGIASTMAVGSVSVLQFAFNLQSVPLTVIGVSYSVAAFPLLAQLYSKGDMQAFVERVEMTLRHLILWIVPLTGIIIVVRAQIVRTILGSGAFDWDDTRLTAVTLSLFAVSLIAQSVNLLIVRGFYAGGNTRTPFIVTSVSTVLTLALSFGLYALFVFSQPFALFVEKLMRVEGVSGAEIMMLPLGYSVMQFGHMCVLLFLFMRSFQVPGRRLFETCARALVSTLGGVLVSYGALYLLTSAVRKETFAGIFLQGLLAGIGGVVAVVCILYILKSPELRELWSSFRQRSFVVKILGPEKIDTLAL